MDDGAAPLDLIILVKLHALGVEYRGVVARLLKAAKRDEILRERARALRIAAALMGGDMATLPRRITQRMGELRHSYRWRSIDLETVDGVIAALLLLSRGKVFQRTTLMDALEARPAGVSAAVHTPASVVYGEDDGHPASPRRDD